MNTRGTMRCRLPKTERGALECSAAGLLHWGAVQIRMLSVLCSVSLFAYAVATSTPPDEGSEGQLKECKFQHAGIQPSPSPISAVLRQARWTQNLKSSFVRQMRYPLSVNIAVDEAAPLMSTYNGLTDRPDDRICEPRVLEVTRHNNEMLVEWSDPECPVSGFFVRLTEIGGNELKLNSNLCNSTNIIIPLGQMLDFSMYDVSVQSVLITDDDKDYYSNPISHQFGICPQSGPEKPTYVAGSVFPNGTAELTWRLSESVWPNLSVNVTLRRAGQTRRSPIITGNRLKFDGLLDANYSVFLSTLSTTEACETRTSTPVTGHFHGKSIVSFEWVKCLRDDKKFYVTLFWAVLPQHFYWLDDRPFQLIRDFYTDDGKLHEEQTPILEVWWKICSSDTGRCQVTLPLSTFILDIGYGFGIVVKDSSNTSYHAERVSRENCILHPERPQARGVVTDISAEFYKKLEDPHVQRMIQLDRESFSLTHGQIEEAMVLIGAAQFMRKGLLDTEISVRPSYKGGKLLPLRITSKKNWNIFAAWHKLNADYEDPELHCSWRYEGVRSGAASCVLGLRKASDCTDKTAVESGCNMFLEPYTWYGVILRGCTSVGCNDTDTAFIFTGDRTSVTTKTPSTTEAPDTRSEIDMWFAIQSIMGLLVVGGIVTVVAVVNILKWFERREVRRRRATTVVTRPNDDSMHERPNRPIWRVLFRYEELVNEPIEQVVIVRRVSDPL